MDHAQSFVAMPVDNKYGWCYIMGIEARMGLAEINGRQIMNANSALQAALEYGGWNHGQDANIAEDVIRDYFTVENFSNMFGGDNSDQCGGFELDECADAVIEWQRESSNV